MSTEQPLQPGRRRRLHKRSRNGCMTCKQRHIRCDEQKPICTNCLVRGGDCGYPESTTTSASAASSSATRLTSEPTQGQPIPQHGQQQQQQSIPIPPATSADPFDVLPVPMPHRSMELFHHFTHYRILSRSLEPKNPNSMGVAIAMQGPGTFRACLLLAAMHYSWMEGSLKTMKETYLYHKLEAMRLVNEQIGDSVLCTSDACINSISALALTESSIGDIGAAEAHLNGLYTLLNIWRPDEWHHRFYGLIQRVALIAGSFVSAAKPFDDDEIDGPPPEKPEDELGSRVPQHYVRPTGPFFCMALSFEPTRLSPFYIGSPPDVEACKSDAEAHIIINCLRRLSSLPVMTGRVRYSDDSEDSEGSTGNSPEPSGHRGGLPLSPKKIAVLLADADSYIASLLFKPKPMSLGPNARDQRARSASPADLIPIDPALRSQSETRAPRTTDVEEANLSVDPYPYLDASLYPYCYRSWAMASYLYLHVVLGHLWVPQQPVDQNMLHMLLDKLKECIVRTEKAMTLGLQSSDTWLWRVMVAAYALTAVRAPPKAAKEAEVALRSGMRYGIWGVGERGEFDTANLKRSGTEGGGSKWKAPAGAAGSAYATTRGSAAAGPARGGSGPPSQAAEGTEIEMRPSVRQDSSDEDDDEDDDEEEEEEDEDDEDDEEDDEEEQDKEAQEVDEDQEMGNGSDSSPRRQSSQLQGYVAEMQGWLEERMSVWSHATKITAWDEVKNALLRTAWLEDFEGEPILERMWQSAVEYSGVVDPLAALDPSLQ